MFSFHCPVAGAEVLRGPRSVLSMRNTSAGIVTSLRCLCGEVVVMVTGQLATAPGIHHPEPVVAAVDDVATEPVPVGA